MLEQPVLNQVPVSDSEKSMFIVKRVLCLVSKVAQNGNVLLGLSKNECCQLSTTEVMSTGAGASGIIATIIAVG